MNKKQEVRVYYIGRLPKGDIMLSKDKELAKNMLVTMNSLPGPKLKLIRITETITRIEQDVTPKTKEEK